MAGDAEALHELRERLLVIMRRKGMDRTMLYNGSCSARVVSRQLLPCEPCCSARREWLL
jgi:hypothetical protein